MEPGVQFAIGIAGGLAVLIIGAAFVGRAEDAIAAVAALGCTALGLMVLADLLIVPGMALQPSASFSSVSLLVTGLQIGAVVLALLALVLLLMGGLTGVVWAARQRGVVDLAVLVGALVALLARVTLVAASLFGGPALTAGTQRDVLVFAGFGLGTLAAALITFWAVPTVRQGARSRRVTASGSPL